MKSNALRIISIVILGLCAVATVRPSAPQSSEFGCSKGKIKPKVGQKITVVGKLASAKLGWIVICNDLDIYIRALRDSDSGKMNALQSFNGHKVKITGILHYSRGSGPQRQIAASVPAHFFFDVGEAMVSDADSPVEMKFREMRLRRPPLAELYFDVMLRNDRSERRWFLLPSNLGSGAAAIGEKGGVDALEAFAPHGQGRVVIGHFLGTGGFHALLLPPRAEVRLRLFAISYWGDPPDHLRIEVVIAKALTIGGEKAEEWFGSDPLSSVKADITENAESPMRMLRSKSTPDNKEVGIVIEEGRRFQLLVSLERKK